MLKFKESKKYLFRKYQTWAGKYNHWNWKIQNKIHGVQKNRVKMCQNVLKVATEWPLCALSWADWFRSCCEMLLLLIVTIVYRKWINNNNNSTIFSSRFQWKQYQNYTKSSPWSRWTSSTRTWMWSSCRWRSSYFTLYMF